MSEDTASDDPPHQRLTRILATISSNPSGAIIELQKLQPLLHNHSIYSPNEQFEDVQTNALSLLALDYHLAMAIIQCPVDMSKIRSPSRRRKEVLERAQLLLHEFLRRMEMLGLFQRIREVPGCYENIEVAKKTYQYLLEVDEASNSSEEQDCEDILSSRATAQHTMTSGDMRNTKIQNFQLKRNADEAVAKLTKLVDIYKENENSDVEELQRKISLYMLVRYVIEAMDQLMAGHKELEMLKLAVAFEKQREEIERIRGSSIGTNDQSLLHECKGSSRTNKPNKPMEVTRVTQDPLTGKLLFKREQIQSKVFQPSWNQPTMTLAELGERERDEAIRREIRQKEAEAQAKSKPRRYEHLVREGMEDDLNLVDASAKMDRQWDDFKDANPRGCGNKLADRGDRNF